MWWKRKKVVTHSGSFHADELFAVAVISILEKGCISVLRTRNEACYKKASYVIDVGGVYNSSLNRFDHHQKEGAGTRENGIPYASFGLVWKTYGAQLCGSVSVAQDIEHRLVIPIDAIDNGISLLPNECPMIYTIHDVIGTFQPRWDERRSTTEAFTEALRFAVRLLEREIARSKAKITGELVVQEAYRISDDKRIIVLPQALPWRTVLTNYPEPQFVIHQSKEQGTWQVTAVPALSGSFENRTSFPQAWAGLRDVELQRISGVSGALFCHRQRFMCVAYTKEAALALARAAL